MGEFLMEEQCNDKKLKQSGKQTQAQISEQHKKKSST
jgi:hypothetical protein